MDLSGVSRVIVVERVAFEQRLEGGERIHLADNLEL